MIELETLKDWYKAAVEQSYNARLDAENDRDFYDGKQWTSEELKELKKRRQPAVVENLIKPQIDTLIGLEITSRTDIKGFPRNPQDDAAAEAATDALRFIADNNDFDQIKTDTAENVFIEGLAAGITEVVPKGNGFEIVTRHIHFDRYFIDPHSMKKDGSDKKYDGMAIWMDEEDAKAQYPKADEGYFECPEDSSEAHSDRPFDVFYNHSRKRVKVIDMFFQYKGKWHRAIFTGLGFVKEPHESPYLDEDGLPENPIESVTAHIDRDNNRYGVVRNLKPLQKEVNARRSRALHLLNTRQIELEDGAVDNVNVTRREAAKADGVIVRNKGFELNIRDNNDLAQGQVVLLEEAKRRIESVGANSSITGKNEQSQSGRAIQAKQQAGVLELTGVMEGLRDWQKRMYRQAWNRVRQFWDEERWIRVTDDEKKSKFIALNRPLTARDVLLSQEGGEEIVAQLEGDPRLEQVVDIENPTKDLMIDIILEDVPDVVNIQAEQFEVLANLASANPDAIPFEMLIEMSSIRNKDRILDRLRGDTPEAQAQVKARMEAEQQSMQIEQAGKIAEIESKKAKAYKDTQDGDAQKLENIAVQSGLMELANG